MKQLALDIGLSSGPTLQNFCMGPNEAALRHLVLWVGAGTTAATRSPVPTYLWGPSGSGKTHLLKAVREALREQGAAVGWMDAGMSEPEPYGDSWVLAAGDQPPALLQVRDDLRTRLGWGHVFGLTVLSEPERRSVLRQAADARGVFLSDEVMDFMLTRFSRDLGSLMELLDLLDGYALQSKRAITVPMIRAMMENS